MITCIPVAMPFAMRGGQSSTQGGSWRFLAQFLAGRGISYVVIGILMGIASGALGAFQRKATIGAMLILSLLLIAHGFGIRLGHFRTCGAAVRFTQHRWFPFALGVLAGISVCPPFLLAIAYTLESARGALAGMTFFVSFFVATTLYVLPLGFLGHLPNRPTWERAGRFAAIAAGGVFLFSGLRAFCI